MNILVLGGNGFVGQEVLTLALEKGYQVSYLSRHPGEGELFTNPAVTYIQGDLLAADSIRLNQNYDWIIDLVGSITPKTLDALNVQARKGTVALANTNHVPNILYLSANVGYPSYVKTKRAGEAIIQKSGLNYIILRSGLIYGPGRPSSLSTAILVKFAIKIPLIGKAFSSIAPTPVANVAEQILTAIEQETRNLVKNIEIRS
ncbi:SDR family oxidoreductase [Aerococcus agrisoli]|nr:NAD(P)H-binding protein [Aerococcus agrisoli]